MIDSTLSPNRDFGGDDLADTIAGVLAEREGTDAIDALADREDPVGEAREDSDESAAPANAGTDDVAELEGVIAELRGSAAETVANFAALLAPLRRGRAKT